MATAKQPTGPIKITDEMVRSFRLVMAIKASDGDLAWEEDGGRRHEYLDAAGRLHHDLLGLQLWDLPVTSDNVERDAVSWPIFQALQAAAAQDAPVGPPVRPREV